MNCKGITKKGIRCSKKISIGEYCWQHKDKGNVEIKDKNEKNDKNNDNNNNTNNNTNNNNIKDNNIKDNNETKTICVKVENLRKHNYISLEDWMGTQGNIYVGRYGRVFISEVVDGTKKIKAFAYKGSKWGNPFKSSDDLIAEQACEKYRQYVFNTPLLVGSLMELKGKILGCFCDQSGSCHAKILKELVDNL